MKTTLNEIRKYRPCADGWKTLLASLNKTEADDEPLSFSHILASNGIRDAIWCTRVLPKNEIVSFAADVAESVLHIYESKYPDDGRPRKAIESARKYSAAAAAAAFAAAAADAYAAARKEKWREIEKIFIKHFCQED